MITTSFRSLRLICLLALALSAPLGCVDDDPADDTMAADPEPEPGDDAGEPEPDAGEPEPDAGEPEPDAAPEANGCAAFCTPAIIETINACLVDAGDEVDAETCLEICAEDDLADLAPCLAEAGDACGAAGACFEDEPVDPITFDIRGTDAIMNGVIDARAIDAVQALIDDHPEVERIVLLDCPGSMDDVSNLVASRLVREAGLATHVPANGVIASGAVDFFTAGVVRTAEVAEGARLGVHSWGGDGVSGADLPRDHPEHQRYLEYYREMGIPEDFYWFTLEAAPVETVHWMTVEEVERYGLVTEG